MIEWPHINRPIHVIHMDQNMLSNRFIMFSEITTDAVFALDEDVISINVDEIEFGYQVRYQFRNFQQLEISAMIFQ